MCSLSPYVRLPLVTGICGLLSTAIVCVIIYCLLLSEMASFIAGVTCFVLSLIYAFVVWINNNDLRFQGMCGAISACLFVCGIQNTMITPTYHVYSHIVNRSAVYITNWMSIFSALCFTWGKIANIVGGQSSSDRHALLPDSDEGFIYICANMFLNIFMGIMVGRIDGDTVLELKMAFLLKSWLFIVIGTLYNTVLGLLVAWKRQNAAVIIRECDTGVMGDEDE